MCTFPFHLYSFRIGNEDTLSHIQSQKKTNLKKLMKYFFFFSSAEERDEAQEEMNYQK